MIGVDFYYENKWLSEFGMSMYLPGSEQSFTEREVERSAITSVRSIPNHYSVHYSDVLTFEFLVIKEVTANNAQSNLVLSGTEINNLRAWLESAKTPKELKIKTCDGVSNEHYFGIFTSVEPYAMDEVCYGLKLTFTCNSPYGFSDETTTTATLNGSSTAQTVSIVNNSAEKQEYMKPTITINSSSTFGNSDSITITNTTDGNKTMSISLPSGSSKLIIDCNKQIITDNSGSLIPLSELGVAHSESNDYSFINADIVLFYWLRLLPGTNSVSVKGSSGNHISTVNISGRYIIKSGGF